MPEKKGTQTKGRSKDQPLSQTVITDYKSRLTRHFHGASVTQKDDTLTVKGGSNANSSFAGQVEDFVKSWKHVQVTRQGPKQVLLTLS